MPVSNQQEQQRSGQEPRSSQQPSPSQQPRTSQQPEQPEVAQGGGEELEESKSETESLSPEEELAEIKETIKTLEKQHRRSGPVEKRRIT